MVEDHAHRVRQLYSSYLRSEGVGGDDGVAFNSKSEQLLRDIKAQRRLRAGRAADAVAAWDEEPERRGAAAAAPHDAGRRDASPLRAKHEQSVLAEVARDVYDLRREVRDTERRLLQALDTTRVGLREEMEKIGASIVADVKHAVRGLLDRECGAHDSLYAKPAARGYDVGQEVEALKMKLLQQEVLSMHHQLADSRPPAGPWGAGTYPPHHPFQPAPVHHHAEYPPHHHAHHAPAPAHYPPAPLATATLATATRDAHDFVHAREGYGSHRRDARDAVRPAGTRGVWSATEPARGDAAPTAEAHAHPSQVAGPTQTTLTDNDVSSIAVSRLTTIDPVRSGAPSSDGGSQRGAEQPASSDGSGAGAPSAAAAAAPTATTHSQPQSQAPDDDIMAAAASASGHARSVEAPSVSARGVPGGDEPAGGSDVGAGAPAAPDVSARSETSARAPEERPAKPAGLAVGGSLLSHASRGAQLSPTAAHTRGSGGGSEVSRGSRGSGGQGTESPADDRTFASERSIPFSITLSAEDFAKPKRRPQSQASSGKRSPNETLAGEASRPTVVDNVVVHNMGRRRSGSPSPTGSRGQQSSVGLGAGGGGDALCASRESDSFGQFGQTPPAKETPPAVVEDSTSSEEGPALPRRTVTSPGEAMGGVFGGGGMMGFNFNKARPKKALNVKKMMRKVAESSESEASAEPAAQAQGAAAGGGDDGSDEFDF